MMKSVKTLENRLSKIESSLEKLSIEVRKKPVYFKKYFTSILIIEKIWKIIKYFWFEIDL